jgi:protein-disulfide isomerase
VLRNRSSIFSTALAIIIAFAAITLTSLPIAAEEAQAPAANAAAEKAQEPAANAASPEAKEPAANAAAEEAKAPTANAAALPDMELGKPDAPVTIIEYSSLSCPHCAAFHKDVLPALKSEYIDTGKARYVMREFPLNESALGGAVIARCLDPSRFFAFTGLLFSKQEDWAFKKDAFTPLKGLAKQAGMTGEEFDKCINDDALQQKVLAVRDSGEKKGVNSTPSFFVNGMPLKGAPTLQNFVDAMKPYLSTQ